MFRKRVVFFFMIYYFKAIKSLVDTKAKDSLTPYPVQPISAATAARPRAALPCVTQKGILILLTEVVEGNNEKDKNSNYDLFFFLFFFYSGKALLQYDRLYDKWHIWKSVVVEDEMMSWAANKLTWPFFFRRCNCLVPRCSVRSRCRKWYKVTVHRSAPLGIFVILIF